MPLNNLVFSNYLNGSFGASYSTPRYNGSPFSSSNSNDNTGQPIEDEMEEILLGIEEGPISIAVPLTDPNLQETAHDLQVKYLDTYGLYLGRPARIVDITSSPEDPYGYIISGYLYDDKGLTTRSFSSRKLEDFDMTLPKIGYINHNNLAIFIERKHKRSSPTRYRKGLRADTLLISNASSDGYREVYKVEDPFDSAYWGSTKVLEKILHSLFYPTFFTYKEALQSLLKFKRLSCAITPSLAMSLDFRTNRILLSRNDFVIGLYSIKERGVVLHTNLFTEELEAAGIIIK